MKQSIFLKIASVAVALLLFATTTVFSQISEMEYFFDTDPGFGNATTLNTGFTPGDTVNLNATIPINSNFSPGVHQLYIRAKNNNKWGHTSGQLFFATGIYSGNNDLVAAEFYFDTDPGFGNATPLSITAGDSLNAQKVIPIPSNLTGGIHSLYVRVKNSQQKWSHSATQLFFVSGVANSAGQVSAMEYYFDQDPGLGNGASLSFSPDDTVQQLFAIPVGTLTTGFHTIYVRAKNDNNIWGVQESRMFMVTNSVANAAKISAAEYFIDTDPGFGNGTAIAVNPAVDSLTTNQVITLPNNLSEGGHALVVRVKDENNTWSHFETQDFVVKYPKSGSGFALNFNGSSDNVDIPVDALGSEYTLTAWVKSSAANAVNQSIIAFSAGNTMTSTSHQIRINSAGKLEHYTFDGSQKSVTSTTTMDTSKWYHVAITGKNNGQMKIYVNGQLEGTPQNLGTLWNLMTTMHLARSTAAGFGFFKGNIDEVALWKVELTEAQIRARMCRKIDATDLLSPQLSYYFNLDENNGNKIYDVDRSKVATINGATWVSSGAAIGNSSISAYAGASSTVGLIHPNRLDSVSVSLTSGSAQGVQLYCVTDSANNINGTTCLSENAGYFGVFPIGGSNVTYNLNYDYTPFIGGGINEGGFKLYKRLQNNTPSWTNSFAAIDSALNLLKPADTLRGEYIVSSAVVLPLISISSNFGDSVCLGTLVQFTATASNQGDTPIFEWRKNGIVVGNNTNTYLDSTLLDQSVITCKLTSNSNCVSPDTAISNGILMKVGNFPASVVISAQPGSQICAGVTVNFTATPSHGGATPVYQWKVNGVNIGGNANVLSLNSLNANDSVSCIMLTSEACALPDTALSNGIIMQVTPTFVPIVALSANTGTTICSGTPVTFTALANSSASTPNYQWKKNGNNVGTNSSVYIDSTLNNGDVVFCQLMSNEACAFPINVNSNTLTFNVNSSVPAAIAITSDIGTTICEQAEVVFSATATNQGSAPVYQWKKNGLNVGTDSSKYVDANLNMNDAISCFLTSSSSCAAPDTASSNILVITTQPYLTPSITISATGADTVCAGTPIVFTATATQTGGSSNFQWLKNGTTISGANGSTYSTSTLTNADTISCKLSSNYPCLAANNVLSGSIFKVILPVPVANAGLDQIINQGSSTVLTASGGISYLWSTNDTASSIIVSPNATTTYTVTAFNQVGCSSSDDVKVTVNYSSLAVSPSSINFGNVVLNNTVNSFVTVTNNGTLPDTVHSASISGAFGTSFSSAILAPAQSVQIPISFLPTNAIFYQEPLLVQTSVGNFTVIVKGKGQLPAAAWTISPSNYSFGNVIVGDSMIHAFSIQNTGNIPITIDTAISNNSLFELWTSSSTIPVNASSIVYAKFKPVAIGVFTGQGTLSSLNNSLPNLTFSLNGLGYVAGAKPVLTFNSAFPYSASSGVDYPVSPPRTFNYSVVYKHPNGTAPQAGFPKVGIDQNNDQDFLDPGEGLFTMAKVGTGNDWVNGETFIFSYQLPLGATYGYQFLAKDSLGNDASAAAVQYISGPLVTNQSIDLNIYANDITFSDNTPNVGQVFTVFAQVRNNSPYPASNVPIRFYNDSLFLAADTIPYIPANTTLTINRNLSFGTDGFYPIKVWIDSSQTLGESNVLNNYAIRPVIVGNFSLPGAITTTSTAITSSCNTPSVGISGRATYSGLNLANNPPVLGATVTVSILNGPTFTTHTVTDGNWNVGWANFGCGQHFDYTVEITDYTLTSALLSDTFLAPCVPCYTPPINPITFLHSGSIPQCVTKLTPTAYTINLASSCNAPTYYNDTTFVYLDNVLLNTHVRGTVAPCVPVFDTDSVTLNVGSYVLSYKHVFYDSAGVRTMLSGANSIIVGDLAEIYTSSFTKTSSTSFSFRNSNGSYCVPAGAHTVFLYDSTTTSGQYMLLDSFNVNSISPVISLNPYVSLSYANPGMEMGNHYLRIVTDVHDQVLESNEANNVFETVFYVPYPELSVTEIEMSNSNIQQGSVVNFTAKIHNTGSGSDTFKVQFYANGIAFGSPIQIDTMVANTTQQIISPTYTIPADTCPIVITAYADVEVAIQELNKFNNKDSTFVAYDLQSGVACFGYGSACSPYVVVRDSIVHFQSVVTNGGTRDVNQNVDVTFTVGGSTIGYDNIGGGIASGTQKQTGVYHSFAAVGSYQILIKPDSANVICELNEGNNLGVIYVNVVEGMPDLELFSEHISPSNLNPMPNQTISVVASVFNKGNQASVPTVVRFWVDTVQLGTDISLSALAAGSDTTVAATATYSSPLVGPKIIKVTVDATNLVMEMNESNNTATRAIIVGAAPDFARTINAGISISNLLPRLEDTISISSAIRNFGGAAGTGLLKFYVKNSASVSTLIDSATFSLGANDSITISKNWVVDFIGNGTIYTEIEAANPQEFNVLNNKESLSITTGPRLRIINLSANDTVLCLADSLALTANVLNDGQVLTFEWKQNGTIVAGALDSALINASVLGSTAGQYTFKVSDNFGSLASDTLSVVVNNPVNILTQPAATLQVCEGNVIELGLFVQNATGYQWQFETNPIPGADSASLRVENVLNAQSGNYRVLMQGLPGCDALLSAPSAVSVQVMNVQLADSGTVDSFYQYDSLTYNYSDDNCKRLASVISGNNNLGLTFVTTTVDTGLLGYVPRYVDIHPQYNLPATVILYYSQQEFDKYNTWAVLNNKPLLPISASDTNINKIVIEQYHGLPSAGTTGPNGTYDATNMQLVANSAITVEWVASSSFWKLTLPVTSFSGFFVKSGSPAIPLPIDLVNFNAVNQGAINRIDWQTLREDQGGSFDLERSANGKSFETLKSIVAQGKPSSYLEYDSLPLSGANYYRLKMNNLDGQSHYSKTVKVMVDAGRNAMLTAYPNPTKDKVFVEISSKITSDVTLQLVSANGKEIRTFEVESQNFQIDLSSYVSGVYLLKYTSNGKTETIKLIKE